MKFSLIQLALPLALTLAVTTPVLCAQDPAASAAKGKDARRPVIWNNADGQSRPGITHHVLHSEAMKRDVGYNVYLPPGYASSSVRYPVIYFLHGAGGNENSDGPGFARLVSGLVEKEEVVPAICVFPNGGMSFYRDVTDGNVRVETMIIKELIPLVDRTYRTRADRGSRLITGYSMGAGGAVRLALTYPHLFSAAGGWGLSFLGRNPEAAVGPEFQPEALKKTPDRIRLLMVIGLDDPGLAAYTPAIKALTDAKYPFTYRTMEGVAHNLGKYYELAGDDMVRFLLDDVAPLSP